MSYKELTSCLVCGTSHLKELFSFGEQPLINNLKETAEEEELKFPIKVNTCQICSHAQLSIAVEPGLLFDKYLYTTGVSESHHRYFEEFASKVNGRNILDIGCNDGSLLEKFYKLGWHCYGVEPAKNLAEIAYNKCNKNSEIACNYFPNKQFEGHAFDVITAFNVFAHNSDPKTFLKEMALLLNDNGRIYIQTTITEVGSIYHEHISYFNPRSMLYLVSLCGLEIKSFKVVPMHKQSYLFEIAKPNFVMPKKLKLNPPFVGYGAAASGMVLLNNYNVRPEYVVDDNTLKQGKFIPGVNVPIYSQDKIINDPRDLTILVLAYNLFDEIKNKIKKLRPENKDLFVDISTGESFE